MSPAGMIPAMVVVVLPIGGIGIVFSNWPLSWIPKLAPVMTLFGMYVSVTMTELTWTNPLAGAKENPDVKLKRNGGLRLSAVSIEPDPVP